MSSTKCKMGENLFLFELNFVLAFFSNLNYYGFQD